MTEHITFEEMDRYLSAEEMTPAFFALGARIAAHIGQCGACADAYEALWQVRRLAQDPAAAAPEHDRRSPARLRREPSAGEHRR